jgi:hypothetical protein
MRASRLAEKINSTDFNVITGERRNQFVDIPTRPEKPSILLIQ